MKIQSTVCWFLWKIMFMWRARPYTVFFINDRSVIQYSMYFSRSSAVTYPQSFASLFTAPLSNAQFSSCVFYICWLWIVTSHFGALKCIKLRHLPNIHLPALVSNYVFVKCWCGGWGGGGSESWLKVFNSCCSSQRKRIMSFFFFSWSHSHHSANL